MSEPTIAQMTIEAAQQVAENAAGIVMLRVLAELASRADVSGRHPAVITAEDVLAVAAALASQLDAKLTRDIAARTKAAAP